MPSARAHHQRRDPFIQFVAFAFRTRKADRPADRILEIDMPVEIVVPSRRVGILKVRHEYARAGVQSVDDHLAVHWPGDFYSTIHQVLPDRRNPPLALADRCRFGQEIGQLPAIDLLLTNLPPRQ